MHKITALTLLIFISSTFYCFGQLATGYRIKYTNTNNQLVYESVCPGDHLSEQIYNNTIDGDSVLSMTYLTNYDSSGLISSLSIENSKNSYKLLAYTIRYEGVEEIAENDFRPKELVAVLNDLTQRNKQFDFSGSESKVITYRVHIDSGKLVIVEKKLVKYNSENIRSGTNIYQCTKSNKHQLDIELVNNHSLARSTKRYSKSIELDTDYRIIHESSNGVEKSYVYDSNGISTVVEHIGPSLSSEKVLNPKGLISDTIKINKEILSTFYWR